MEYLIFQDEQPSSDKHIVPELIDELCISEDIQNETPVPIIEEPISSEPLQVESI